MLDAESIALSPAWLRLGELLGERGWSGRNDVEPPPVKRDAPNR
jgi:hypothetical protein